LNAEIEFELAIMAAALKARDVDDLAIGGLGNLESVDLYGKSAEDAVVLARGLWDDEHSSGGRCKGERLEKHGVMEFRVSVSVCIAMID
jgi:hypothetical protein